ncbi:ATP-dependent Clp protease proteolytic subunit 2 [compost metagenome]
MDISIKQVLQVQKELYQVIARHSGQTYDRINEAASRDYWMSSAEAKEFGMIDEILSR